MLKKRDGQIVSAIAVAPMMDWTDRHCRYFMRLLNPNAWLYTEMVTAAAIHHGEADRFLRFHASEHPVALQLGGSDPKLMASATRKAAEYGYDEININVGCPERSRTKRHVRRLPHGDTPSGCRLLPGDVSRDRYSDHGQNPHRY